MADLPDKRFAKTQPEPRLADTPRVAALIPRRLRALHDTIVDRALRSEAEALILTGSTARGARTPLSDLDYHLIGDPIDTDDLPGELDLHVLSAAELRRRLREGDDFVHWSLRFGRVIFDRGVIAEAVLLIRQHQLWPDAARKLTQASKSLSLARAMVASGDEEAALEQVCTALTLTARWRLLHERVFPLSRAELPTQLKQTGHTDLAAGLAASIRRSASPESLSAYLDAAETLIMAATPRPAGHIDDSRAA